MDLQLRKQRSPGDRSLASGKLCHGEVPRIRRAVIAPHVCHSALRYHGHKAQQRANLART